MNQDTLDIPLVSSSQLEQMGLNWCMVDQIQGHLRDRQPLIVNTDVSSGGGIHWICLVPIDQTVEIIDPLGPRNYRSNDPIMKAQLKGYRIHFYPGKFQMDSSQMCGFFSSYVALLIRRLPTISVESVEAAVNQAFGKTADDGDIRLLIRYFHLNNFLERS